jgi:hypothetical protein
VNDGVREGMAGSLEEGFVLSRADELLEQFGELLTKHAADSPEVIAFYKEHQEESDFKELADSLLELMRQSEVEDSSAARQRWLMPAAAVTLACVPVVLFVSMMYIASTGRGQIAALTEEVKGQIPTLERQLDHHAQTSLRIANLAQTLEEQVSGHQEKMEALSQLLNKTNEQIATPRIPLDSSGVRWVYDASGDTSIRDFIRSGWMPCSSGGLSDLPTFGGSGMPGNLAGRPPKGTVQFAGFLPSSASLPIPNWTSNPGVIVEDVDGSRLRLVDVDSSPEVEERFYIYEDDATTVKFSPTAWMPDGNGISQATNETDSPQAGEHCIRLHCALSSKPWVGVYFLLEGTWEPTESFNLFDELNAKQGDPIKCRFWARSENGAVVQFKVGGVTMSEIRDSLRFPVSSPSIELTPDWELYEIDLSGMDVSSLVGGFVWTCDRQHNGGDDDVSFDLDTIYFVKLGTIPGDGENESGPED